MSANGEWRAMASRLYEVLTEHAPNRLGLGDDFDPIGFRQDLGGVIVDLRRMYWMTAMMIVVVFCVEIAVGLFYREDPTILAAIAAAVGVTVWGAVDRMGRLTREMAQTNLTVILSERLAPEMVERIVQSLLDGLKRDSGKS
jgi:hypothetical protein